MENDMRGGVIDVLYTTVDKNVDEEIAKVELQKNTNFVENNFYQIEDDVGYEKFSKIVFSINKVSRSLMFDEVNSCSDKVNQTLIIMCLNSSRDKKNKDDWMGELLQYKMKIPVKVVVKGEKIIYFFYKPMPKTFH